MQSILRATHVARFFVAQESPIGDFVNFGQLIRENNKALDKTFVYEYKGTSFDSTSIMGEGPIIAWTIIKQLL